MKNTMESKFIESAALNRATFNDYMFRFKKLATSIFEWVNLPDSCDARWLELCLFYFGQAAFLYDKDLGFINTKAIPNDKLNIYGIPTKINCYSYEYQKMCDLYTGLKKYKKEDVEDDSECILIMNNYDRVATEPTLNLFCRRLYEVERTIDVNIKSQKFPLFIVCDEKQRLTMKNLYMKYEGNEPVIFGDKNLFSDGSKVEAIKTDAPYIADKLQEYKMQIWNEMLTFLGINNINVEKKERLVTGEVDNNNEVINLNLQSYLITRKEACKQINEKFGLNVDVRVRSDLENLIKTFNSSVSDLQKLTESEVDVNE